MSALPGFLLVLAGFGFLIFIHELGHFLAAKWAGIRADGFAIGMGPCVASYRRGVGLVAGSADARVVARFGKRPIEMSDREREANGLGETEYSLRALPLGGYVRMLGQEDGNPEATSDDPRSFGRAPHFRRGVVILAGIAANLALAVVLFLVAFLAGVRFPAPTVGFVAPDSPAARAVPVNDPGESATQGLRPGDSVVAIDGDRVLTFVDLRVAAAMAKPDTPLAVEVERGGERLRYEVLPQRDPASGLLAIGVDPARGVSLTDVRVSRETVAAAIAATPDLVGTGVVPGATVESADGAPVRTFAELEAAARASDGAPVEVVWRTPAGERIETRLVPRPDFETLRAADPAEGADLGLAGLAPLARVRQVVATSANVDAIAAGDVFLRVAPEGGAAVEGPRLSELMRTFRGAPSTRIAATVLRGGVPVETGLETNADGQVGIYLEPAWELPIVARPLDEVATADGVVATPAKALELVPLARIESVDGAPVADFLELRQALVARARAHSGDAALPVTIGFRDPGDGAAPVDATTELAARDLAALRALGHSFPIDDAFFDPLFTVLSANGNPLEAVRMGFRQTLVMIEQVFLTIDRVGRGSVGVNQLQGPVGILHTGTQVADEGFMYVVFFLALISVNLAVVNALPIPIADGGLLLFLIYEKFAGRPPSIAFQNAAAMAGIAFVAGLFLLTFYNDLGRLFG